MTFTELMGLLNGNYIEVAGTDAKNQCVDLANAYIKYCLGLPPIEWTNARDFPSKAGDEYVYIENTPTGVPEEGDLIIWGGNQYGHIAIFIEGDANKFKSFDENYPTGSPCRVVEHTYYNVIGWLRPKAKPQDQSQTIEALRMERDRNWNFFVAVCQALNVGTNVDLAEAEARKLVEIEDKFNDQGKKLTEAQAQLADYQTKLTDANGQLVKLSQVNTSLQAKVDEQDKKIQDAMNVNLSLQGSIEELKKQITQPELSGWGLIVKGFVQLFVRR